MPAQRKQKLTNTLRAIPALAPKNLSTPRTGRTVISLACLALTVLVVLAYGNSLGNGFVWDDHQQIVMNPAVRADAPLTPIFTADVRFARHAQTTESSDYRPLQMLTYRLLHGSFGPDAEVFHACSLLFALGCALAAFAVFIRLTPRPGVAFAAAALFAVYPVHTEAVDWIAALPELGCTLCLLLSFWAWLKASTPASKIAGSLKSSHWLWLAFSWLNFAAALLWKETALIFPALLGTYILLAERSDRPLSLRALQQTAPFWGLLAGYLAVRYTVLGTLSAGPRDWQLSSLHMLCNIAWLLVAYWGKLAFPVALDAYHTFHPIRSLADPRALAALAVLLAFAFALATVFRRPQPALAASAESAQADAKRLALFATAWVFLTLLPAMNLAGVGRNVFTERYLFLPSAGFCFLLALTADWLIRRGPAQHQRIAACLLLSVALAACLAETILRNPDWKDDLTLFTTTLDRSPDAPFVRSMLANLQSSNPGQSAATEQNYSRAIELARAEIPVDKLDAINAYQGLASFYADRGRYAEAIQTLRQADTVVPGNDGIAGEEGLILARSGKGPEALPLLQRAAANQPDDVNILTALALVERDDLHDTRTAKQLFEKALALHTEDDDFAASQHNNLGVVFSDENNSAGAVAQFREAVRIQPNDPEFHLNLAMALGNEGHISEARAEAEAAVRMAPNDPASRQLLQQLNELAR